MRANRTFLILACLLAACSSSGRDRSTPLPVEEPGEETRAMYTEAQRAFEEKRYDDAVDLFEEVYETWPTSRLAPEAEFWAAESLYQDGELRASFLAFKRFLELHSLYGRIDRVEKRLFDIGTRQFREGESGILGLGIFKSSGDGVETLTYLSDQFPSGEYADDALMEIARYHRRTHELEDAKTTLTTLLDRYPTSPHRFPARLLLASSYRELNRGIPYDPGTLREARKHYDLYVREVSADPERAKRYASRLDLARRRLREIDETLGGHELLTARWYIHLEEDEAAAFYLSRTASLYPATEAGREAAGLLREMGRDVPEVTAEPEPPAREPASPGAGSK
jgi:outer membrane protein assembly factor BamD (BamD/ComL family)